MSTPGGDYGYTPEKLELLQDYSIEGYVLFGSCAMVLCEHIALFPREIQLFWKNSATAATYTFLLNRYVVLLAAISQLFQLSSWSSTLSCEVAGFIIPEILFNAAFVIVASFTALRVFAVSRHNLYIALLVWVCGLVPAVINTVTDIEASEAYILTIGKKRLCLQNTNLSNSLAKRLELAARLSAIASDVIVIIATWYYNGSAYRRAWKTNFSATLGTLVLRDGTLYFVCILFINILQLYVDISRPSPTETGSYVIILLVFIPSVLFSRFLLNLREASTALCDAAEDLEDTDTIVYAQNLSSLRTASTSGGGTRTSFGRSTFEMQGLQKSRLARDEENVCEAGDRDIPRRKKLNRGPSVLNIDDFSL